MPPYRELYPAGSRVRIRGAAELEAFRATWRLHDPLSADQLRFADTDAIVASVGFYHGGDPLYVLANVSGIWHEVCLSSLDPPAV